MALICSVSRRSTAHMAPWAVWMGYCNGSGRTWARELSHLLQCPLSLKWINNSWEEQGKWIKSSTPQCDMGKCHWFQTIQLCPNALTCSEMYKEAFATMLNEMMIIAWWGVKPNTCEPPLSQARMFWMQYKAALSFCNLCLEHIWDTLYSTLLQEVYSILE